MQYVKRATVSFEFQFEDTFYGEGSQKYNYHGFEIGKFLHM